jgi:uncharacterized protein
VKLFGLLFLIVVVQGCGTFEPLHHAAANGDQATVRLLLDRGDNVNAKNLSGWTPLMHAAFIGNVRIAQMLLDSGADTTITNNYGQTALSIAQDQDNTLVVDLLKRYESRMKTTQ